MTIAQFENGLITKAKMNELVDKINDIDIRVIGLVADVTKTVGTGGDFTTLNDAINWCKKVFPNGYGVTLNLLSGFTWTENILIENENLRFVTISSVDENVILNTADYTYAITVKRSIAPIWNILLQSTSGTRNGMSLYGSDIYIKNEKGVIGCFQTFVLFENSYMNSNGRVSAYSNFGTSFGNIGIYNSEVGCGLKCNILDVVGGVYSGGDAYVNEINVSAGGSIRSYFTIRRFSGSGNINLNVNDNSEVYVDFVDNSLSTTLDIICRGSRCVVNGTFSLSTIRNIYSEYGSHVTLINSTVVTGQISVYRGGIVSAYGAGGTLSQTANTITANGIIFQ